MPRRHPHRHLAPQPGRPRRILEQPSQVPERERVAGFGEVHRCASPREHSGKPWLLVDALLPVRARCCERGRELEEAHVAGPAGPIVLDPPEQRRKKRGAQVPLLRRQGVAQAYLALGRSHERGGVGLEQPPRDQRVTEPILELEKRMIWNIPGPERPQPGGERVEAVRTGDLLDQVDLAGHVVAPEAGDLDPQRLPPSATAGDGEAERNEQILERGRLEVDAENVRNAIGA